MASQAFQFLTTASRREHRVLAASTLGWMLDGMDVMLFSVVIAELMRALGLSTSQAGYLVSVTLMGSAVGGLIFGVLADRAGRRLALMTSIALYSVFTAACGFARGVAEFTAFRFLVGLGMGGEWSAGAALVAETWKAEHRGKALGLMQSGFAVGYALAALIAALVLPRWGWHAVFFVGILPALLTLWIRRGVPESPLWLEEVNRRRATGPVPDLNTGLGKNESAAQIPHPVTRNPTERASPVSSAFAPPYLKLILLTLLMNSAALFGWWALFTWIPPYLALPEAEGGRGLAVAASSAWIGVMQVGMWLGYASFGFVSDAVGRKKTYVGYLVMAAALVPLYGRVQATSTLLLLGPLVAFFGTGHFTGFGIIAAEIFPTSFRASAMGLTYNFGRALSAVAPWAIGALAERHGLGSAFAASGIAFLVAALLALALPETRHRALE